MLEIGARLKYVYFFMILERSKYSGAGVIVEILFGSGDSMSDLCIYIYIYRTLAISERIKGVVSDSLL